MEAGDAPSQVSPLFAGVDREDLDELLGAGREVSFSPGEAIFEVGDEADAMFVVLEGEARVDVGGRFHRLERGAFFGEMALLAPDKRMATVRAVQPVRALRIPADAFRALLMERPRIGLAMLKTLAIRLREVEQRMDAWMAS